MNAAFIAAAKTFAAATSVANTESEAAKGKVATAKVEFYSQVASLSAMRNEAFTETGEAKAWINRLAAGLDDATGAVVQKEISRCVNAALCAAKWADTVLPAAETLHNQRKAIGDEGSRFEHAVNAVATAVAKGKAVDQAWIAAQVGERAKKLAEEKAHKDAAKDNAAVHVFDTTARMAKYLGTAAKKDGLANVKAQLLEAAAVMTKLADVLAPLARYDATAACVAAAAPTVTPAAAQVETQPAAPAPAQPAPEAKPAETPQVGIDPNFMAAFLQMQKQNEAMMAAINARLDAVTAAPAKPKRAGK